MTYTYTFTARNEKNPEKVITFTIIDDYLKVNLTGLIDQVSDLVEEDTREEAIKTLFSTQSGSALYKAIERLSGPVHINDVSYNLEGKQFKLTLWKRLAGLRVAPITIAMGDVDNPEGAAQFIDTLMARQELAEGHSVFAGPLDYWITWIGMLIGLIILIRWPRKEKS
ncbi:MAG: hypothetical protein SVP52_03590 [Chloroflexota bacterium]|nr:hypothetical protein [Chloroflexota bacterium]